MPCGSALTTDPATARLAGTDAVPEQQPRLLCRRRLFRHPAGRARRLWRGRRGRPSSAGAREPDGRLGDAVVRRVACGSDAGVLILGGFFFYFCLDLCLSIVSVSGFPSWSDRGCVCSLNLSRAGERARAGRTERASSGSPATTPSLLPASHPSTSLPGSPRQRCPCADAWVRTVTRMPSLSCLLAPSPIGYGSCPSLPSSPSSIAILGPGLPASSAVHLSLAHLGPGQRALILVKDVQAWTSCLLSDGPANDGDAWIRERAGRGEQARTLARVDVRSVQRSVHYLPLCSLSGRS